MAQLGRGSFAVRTVYITVHSPTASWLGQTSQILPGVYILFEATLMYLPFLVSALSDPCKYVPVASPSISIQKLKL